jgi:hypothetical protein
VIKSNSLDSLGFDRTSPYPIKATLQGKCNLQIIRASDGALLGGEGNLSVVATATDAGLPSSNQGDYFSLTVTRTDNSVVRSFTSTQLGGGNVVVHTK